MCGIYAAVTAVIFMHLSHAFCGHAGGGGDAGGGAPASGTGEGSGTGDGIMSPSSNVSANGTCGGESRMANRAAPADATRTKVATLLSMRPLALLFPSVSSW